jgi:L-alanine-DL-glutamate epimerase-like enolase superfamily enzyme
MALDPTKAGRNALIIWMHMDNGIVGIGEAAPVGPGRPPSIAEIAAVLHDLAPSALGLHPAVAFDVLSALAPSGSIGDALRFGLETAAFDGMGKNAGRPVTDLLGGVIDWVPMVALLDYLSPDAAAEQASQAVMKGYECVKVSLGDRDPDVDIEVVRRVRQAIGDAAAIRADADESWTAERAIYTIERLRPYRLEFVEQPVIAEDLSGLARIRRSTHVPIAADEVIGTLADAQRVVEADAADVLVVKAARAGGLRHAQAIMSYARQKGLRSTVSSSLETGVGIAAGLHVSTSLGKAAPASLGTSVRLEHDLLAKPLVPVRGHITVPHLPGLGVELDSNAVDRYTTDIMGVIAG